MRFNHQPNTDRKVIYKYAEEWLQHAVTGLRSHFLTYGHIVPELHVSCGYSFHGFNPKIKTNFDGYYMPKRFSKDNIPMIFISPNVVEPVDVMFVLAHELIHAVDDCYSLHGFRFKTIARELGINDCGGVRFIDHVNCVKKFSEIAEPLGQYPRRGVSYENSFSIPNPDIQEQRKIDMEFKRNKLIGSRRSRRVIIEN